MNALTCVLILFFIAAVFVYFTTVNGNVLYPTLPNLTFLFHFLNVLGIMAVVAEHRLADAEWTTMNLLGPISMVGGALVATISFKFAPRQEWNRWQTRPLVMDVQGINYTVVVGCIACLSLFILTWYTIASGGHMVLSVVSDIAGGSQVGDVTHELATNRMKLTAGTEGYWAPGYLIQFRDVLLPCLTMFVYCQWKIGGRRFAKWPFFLLFLATLYFILGSGRRSPVVLFLFAFALVTWNARGTRLELRKVPKLVFVLMFAVFIGLTLLLGREQASDSIFETIGNGLYNFYERIAVVYALQNLLSKPVWDQIGPLYGMGWWDGLMQVLPGTQRSLYNDLHSYLGGSDQGNSALNLWAEVWINWGMLGVPCIGFLYGYVLQSVHIRFVRKQGRRVRELVFYCLLSSFMPLVTQPLNFLVKGGLTLFILSVLFRIGDMLNVRLARTQRKRGHTSSPRGIIQPETI